MATLTSATSKVVKEAEELIKQYMKVAVDNDVMEYVDDTTMDIIKSGMKFFKSSTDLIMQQAKAIDEMNDKLDRLLAK